MDKDEKARVSYEVAVKMWQWEGDLIWSKSNAMLVANSVVLAIIGLAITNRLRAIAIGLSFAGLLLCFLWYLATVRGFDNVGYWILCARELEGSQLNDETVKYVSRGAGYARGESVTFHLEDNAEYRMSDTARLLSVKQVAYGIIAVFAVVYVCAFLYASLTTPSF